MEQPDTSTEREPSFFWRWLRKFQWRFFRHELWAIRAARRAPLLSLHFAMTLVLVWLFLPVAPILLGLALLIESTLLPESLRQILNLFVFGAATVFLVAVMPWSLRWYFICAGLMFGSHRMAALKEADILARLEEFE